MRRSVQRISSQKGMIPVIVVVVAAVVLTAGVVLSSLVSTNQNKKISSVTRATFCQTNGDYGPCQSFQNPGDCAQGEGGNWFYCGPERHYHGPCTESECKSGTGAPVGNSNSVVPPNTSNWDSAVANPNCKGGAKLDCICNLIETGASSCNPSSPGTPPAGRTCTQNPWNSDWGCWMKAAVKSPSAPSSGTQGNALPNTGAQDIIYTVKGKIIDSVSQRRLDLQLVYNDAAINICQGHVNYNVAADGSFSVQLVYPYAGTEKILNNMTCKQIADNLYTTFSQKTIPCTLHIYDLDSKAVVFEKKDISCAPGKTIEIPPVSLQPGPVAADQSAAALMKKIFLPFIAKDSAGENGAAPAADKNSISNSEPIKLEGTVRFNKNVTAPSKYRLAVYIYNDTEKKLDPKFRKDGFVQNNNWESTVSYKETELNGLYIYASVWEKVGNTFQQIQINGKKLTSQLLTINQSDLNRINHTTHTLTVPELVIDNTNWNPEGSAAQPVAPAQNTGTILVHSSYPVTTTVTLTQISLFKNGKFTDKIKEINQLVVAEVPQVFAYPCEPNTKYAAQFYYNVAEPGYDSNDQMNTVFVNSCNQAITLDVAPGGAKEIPQNSK